MTGRSPLERPVLAGLADPEEAPPTVLTLETGVELGVVRDALAVLRDRGLRTRRGFDACRLMDRGRERLDASPRT
jgi:hypothetical protein